MFNRILQGLALISLVAFVRPVYAVTVSVSNIPSSVDQSQEFDVDVFLSCDGCGDSYFRGVFYPNGTNYFGFTRNNEGQWIGTSDNKTQYFKVGESELSEGSWSGKLKVKPDKEDSAYSGSGNYLFKVGRYTAGGSPTWSNELALVITGPTPTNTPTKTPTQSPQATNTPTPTPIKSGPTPIKSGPTKTPTPKTSPSLTATAAAVLGVEASVATSTATASGGFKQALPLIIALLLIAIGLAILGFVLVWKKRKTVI